ncbi:MAG: glycosyltransferase family 39 protein [Synergistaceae bacterium]
MDRIFQKKYMVIVAILAVLAVYFLSLGSYGLLEEDEGRYSEIPREMIESGDYVTPKLNYVKYFEKPVLLYWMNAASFHVFGETEFAARFPSTATAVLGALVTGLLATQLFGFTSGILAALITALSLLYFAVGQINITDMPLSFFLTLAMATFYYAHISGKKAWYALFYASMACAVLTKGLIGIVLPCGIIFWYIIFTKKWKLFIEPLYIPGIILFFAITVPWFYAVCKANEDFFYFFFIYEHFVRFSTTVHNRYEPIWYFVPMIPLGLMPWTGFFFSLFSKKSIIFSKKSEKDKNSVIFLLLWFAVIFVFFSISKSKLIPYVVPCMPPLAILMGVNISSMIESKKWFGGAMVSTAIISVFISVGLFVYAFVGKLIPTKDTLPIAIEASVPLLLGTGFALFFSAKKNFRYAILSLVISAFFFMYSLAGIFDILNDTRSFKDVSTIINKELKADETLVVFGDLTPGINFYTKKRILYVDHYGELEFGGKKEEGKGWFIKKKEFLKDWNSGNKKYLLVVQKKRFKKLFPNGVTGETKRIVHGDTIILFNRR